ncbi:MAG: cobaltochelatase subunit CobN, partial [Methanobacterium sp.]
MSAANTTTGGDSGGMINSTDLSSSSQNSSLKEVKITGQVLDCVTSKPFPGVNVTVSGNGNKLSSTKTNSKGEYELRFLSNLTQFNVTASYTGHKPSSQIVNTHQYTSNNSTILQGTATFKLGKPKVVFLFTSSSAISNALMNALNENQHFTSEVYLLKNLPANIKITDYDLVFIDYLASSTPNLEKVKVLIEEAKAKNIPVIITKNYDIPDQIDIISTHPWIRNYWSDICPENAKNMIKYIAVKFLGANDTYQAPITLTKVGIYHPDAGKIFSNLTSYLAWYKKYNKDNPTVAVMFGQASYNKANTASVDALIRGFEAKGYNVIPYFLDHETYALGKVDINTFLVSNGVFLPDLVIHYRAAGWDMIKSYNETMAELIAMNVPIIKALTYEGSYQEWLNSTQGIGSATFAYSVTNGEKQGIIDPIVIATTETDSNGIPQTIPVERQINWLIDRAVAQINLQRLPN